MRLLLWNTNGGPRPRALEWVTDQARASWDVAVLLEVNRMGWTFLDRPGWTRTGTIDSVQKPGRRLGVAILARPGFEPCEVVDPPAFTTRNGRYTERAHALSLTDPDGSRWTVVGAHMPNSWTRSGKNHSYKEDCYRELQSWIRQRPADERLVIAMDSNRSDWEFSTSLVKEHSKEAQRFVRQSDPSGGLIDCWVASDPSNRVRPATYWQPRTGAGAFFDRVFVNALVTVQPGSCQLALPRDAIGKGRNHLSDHAPVTVDLRPRPTT